MAEIICNAHTDRPLWLRERKKGVGASDSPSVLSIPGAWSSAPEIAETKWSKTDEETRMPEYVDFGHVVEPWLLEKLRRELGAESADRDGNLFRHDEIPWLLATLDGQIVEKSHGGAQKVTPAEMKSTAYEDKYTTHGKVPEDVWCQVQHQMKVLEVPSVYCAVFYRVSCKWNWSEVIRDDAFIDDVLVPGVAEFWQHILEKNPYGLKTVPTPECRAALARIFAYDAGAPPAELGGRGDELADIISDCRQDAKGIEERVETAKLELIEMIGDAPQGFCPTGRYFNLKPRVTKEHMRRASTSRPLLGPYGE